LHLPSPGFLPTIQAESIAPGSLHDAPPDPYLISSSDIFASSLFIFSGCSYVDEAKTMNNPSHIAEVVPTNTPSEPTVPFVSIIIPVLNDAKRLRLCLQALAQQTYPASHYEIIVVDNGSDAAEDIAGVVADFRQTFERSIAAYESYPSSFAARNRGITLATGDVIAFTDADCLPAPNWLEAGVDKLLNVPNCGLVGGRVDIFFRQPDRATPVELYESITAFPQQELVERHQYAATANVFTFKRVLEQVGGFEADLKSSGDIEWGQRIAAHGYQLVYADDARVSHPARYSWEQLFKRTVRLAGGLYDLYQRECYSAIDRNRIYAKQLIENLVPPVNFVRRVFFHSPLPGLKQKLQVSAVMVFVRYVSAGELIRLKLGGTSMRD
jgi:glycosyltransferase involved in cell wall biosynthesis